MTKRTQARVVPLLLGGLATLLLAACNGTGSEGGGDAEGAGKENADAIPKFAQNGTR